MSHPPSTPLFLSHFFPNLERLCISNFLIFFFTVNQMVKNSNFHSIFLHLLSFNPLFNPTKHTAKFKWLTGSRKFYMVYMRKYLMRPSHTRIFFHVCIPSIYLRQNIYIFGSNYNSTKP